MRSNLFRVTRGPPWPVRLLARRAASVFHFGGLISGKGALTVGTLTLLREWVEESSVPGGRTLRVPGLDSRSRENVHSSLSKLPERLDCLDSFSRAITILAGENSGRVRERREGKVPTGASRWNKSGVSAFPE